VFGSRKGKTAEDLSAKPAAGATSAASVGNGGASKLGDGGPADAKATQEAQMRAAIAIRQSVAFAQIVSVLMRSPHYKHYTLSDLEWLVFPPLMTGQFSIAEASTDPKGPKFPAAVVLWANVSAEVDKRLSENLFAPMRLRPDEWRSGEALWLVDAVGDARVVPELLKRLRESVFKGKDMKIRSRDAEGKPTVQILRPGT
jgi:hemolysin-activating ACP:hemolysin acyltransferase